MFFHQGLGKFKFLDGDGKDDVAGGRIEYA